MKTPNRYWMLVTVLLIVVIAAGGMVVGSRYGKSQPIEISNLPAPELTGSVYIGGDVASPGFYPLRPGDTVDALVKAAGGATDNADLSELKIYVSESGKAPQPQKVDLNRAESWLLEALPGIGEARARAIIDYRNQEGGFHNINELLKVKGISLASYDQVKSLVTVAE